MSEGSRGWVGSLIVHVLVVGALVGASWLGARQSDGTLDASPLIVDLNGLVGRKAGQVGHEAGAAQGSATGSKLFHFKPVDMAKVREAAQPDAGGSSGSTPRTRPNGPGSRSTSSGARESIDDFNRSRGNGRGTGGGTTGGVAGVQLGHSNGTGDNGGEGGRATAQQVYAGEVLARFRQAWADVVTSEGEDLGSLRCGVKVTVSASGNVSFAGFIAEPASAKAKALVRRAVGQIGNCGQPPDGKAFEIDFPSVSTAEGG